MRQVLRTAAGCLMAILLLAQSPTVSGLKVLSTTIDPKTRAVTVAVQNMTEKTIVGYGVVYHQFSADNRPLGEGGIITDLNGPDNSGHAGWISPGQIATIRDGYAAGPGPTVLFEDDTSVGERPPAQIMFTRRSDKGKEAREQAAKETGAKKAELERKAEWYEAHALKN